jgi:TonB-dependent SusC/RagA subfamily outer membrane receptor
MKNRQLTGRAVLMSVMLFAVFLSGFSQTKTVSGKIVGGKESNPVANATVTLKGTTTATATDAGGNFSITVPGDNAILVITSVGYQRIEIPVEGKSQINVSLNEAAGNLNEVVVVGYGTTRKRDLTGAVSSVSSKDFVKGALQTPEQLIAGKVAGVQITSNGGAPGSGSRIRIRGGASLNASNDPLIVIDGVPVDNSGVAGSSNPLNLINPNDIENFTILKDPSAAAIYGSRASNGVILITTKKGQRGKLKFNFGSQFFAQTPGNKVDVLSAQQIRDIVGAKGSGQPDINKLGTANTDWQDEIYRTAFGQD